MTWSFFFYITMQSISDLKLKDKIVLVRCDFNVPLDEAGNILDDFRIVKSLPTLQYLVKHKAKIIIMSHLGEPNGEVVPTLRLDKVREKLESLLKLPVMKVDDCLGQEAKKQASWLGSGQILLLENLRFYSQETSNDLIFARQLASLGEFYINDAFADCHRNHASIASLPLLLPSAAGLLLEKEIENLNTVLINPKKPLVVLVGGIKVKTKAPFIEHITKIADAVLVSGLIQRELLEKNIQMNELGNIISPIDVLGSEDISAGTLQLFTEKILSAKTIIWNGPFGKFEEEQYKKGTLELAKAIIKSKAFSVVGGGETIEFLHKEGMLDQFSHVSTGGGAMLAYLAGEVLPGLKALENNENQN